MDRRLELHDKLVSIFKENVFYQPPESIKLKYPCFLYELSGGQKERANNSMYIFTRRYDCMYITRDPDNEYIELLLSSFRYISYDRRYVSNNLYHDTFTIYY